MCVICGAIYNNHDRLLWQIISYLILKGYREFSWHGVAELFLEIIFGTISITDGVLWGCSLCSMQYLVLNSFYMLAKEYQIFSGVTELFSLLQKFRLLSTFQTGVTERNCHLADCNNRCFFKVWSNRSWLGLENYQKQTKIPKIV